MLKRVVQHMKRLGLWEGETLYSLKRGSMQHRHSVLGHSLQAVGESADILTDNVVKRYLDPNRHHDRGANQKRQRRA